MKILHVVGARPNFMKMAPVLAAMERRSGQFDQKLVHTGQHYDEAMSRVFFEDLGMPHPDVNLEVGSGSHAAQTAQIMMRFEPLLREFQPDWLLVPGDVNSTLACSLVAAKMGVRVAHVEAGLRSWDRGMPEEINRIVTDHVADLLLTPSRDADENLLREGIAAVKIAFVGNVMIDTLVRLLPKARELWPDLAERFGLSGDYALVTLHRPSNVDDPAKLSALVSVLNQVAERTPVVFPVHPRTQSMLAGLPVSGRISLAKPLGYLEFLALQGRARFVVTDSGGIQEETTYLGVPCFTMRDNTERPITVTHGTNRLIRGGGPELLAALDAMLASPPRPAAALEYWDGAAAERIVDAILRAG